MKIFKEKPLEEEILTESGKSAGDYFEIGAAAYLNKYFKIDNNILFYAKQDTGHGDIECRYYWSGGKLTDKNDGRPYDVLFNVECKLGDAQAGQMSLDKKIADAESGKDEDAYVEEFSYKHDDSPLGKLIEEILNRVNTVYKSDVKYRMPAKSYDWGGVNIGNSHFEIVDTEQSTEGETEVTKVDAVIDNSNNLFQKFVETEYNSANTLFFIFGKKLPHTSNEAYRELETVEELHPAICLTDNIHNAYNMDEAIVRLKIDADPVKIGNCPKEELISRYRDSEYSTIVDASGKKQAYITLREPIKVTDKTKYRQTINGVTYQVNTKKQGIVSASQENIKKWYSDTGIEDIDKIDIKYAQQLRFIRDNRVIFIITMALNSDWAKYNDVTTFVNTIKSKIGAIKKSNNKAESFREHKEFSMNKKRKKNLSEELVINKDITLDAREDAKDELEKDAEKFDKEVNKELKAKVKDVEDINDAKTPDIDLKDGEGKTVKIKGLTERLTLEEPSNILNESAEDEWQEDVYNLQIDIYHLMTKLKKKYKDTLPFADYFGALEDAADGALGMMENGTDIDEDVELTEKIPGDLAKAYGRTSDRYSGALGGWTDLENAEYREVTPEEAKKIYKENPQSLRVLIDGQLVDFDERGWNTGDHRVRYLGRDKQYTNRNGKIINDTKYIPQKHLLDVADKIYVTNERESRKDQELLDKRKANKLGDYALQDYDNTEHDRWDSEHQRRGRSGVYGMSQSNYDYAYRNMLDYQRRLAEIQNDPYMDETRKQSYIARYKGYIEDQKKILADIKNYQKDRAARTRYGFSELNLQKPFKDYKEIKSDLERAKRNLERKKAQVDELKNSGSDEVRSQRSELNDLVREYKDLRRRIAQLEMQLEDADKTDAKAVELAQRDYEQVLNRNNELQARMDALLRRN